VLSRTSNLYGMLTTDDPFQYLGGIALAVRHLDGKAPELYISNLRGQGSGKVEGAASSWPRSWPRAVPPRLHPGPDEGGLRRHAAGAGRHQQLLGLAAVAREIVRDDQWQEMVDVYVRDKHSSA
jgi:cobaltochelatase CobN